MIQPETSLNRALKSLKRASIEPQREQVLTRNIKDEKLQKWFLKMAGEIASLDAADPTVSGRKMQQLLSAMEDVEQFHQIESNQHVKHFLGDARELLRQMVRTVGLLLSLLALQVQKSAKTDTTGGRARVAAANGAQSQRRLY